MQRKRLRIATRESPLALWQAEWVRGQLLKHHPELDITLLPMKTTGDRFLKSPLQDLGGKDLFVKELEEALMQDRADFAVHSMKDVPINIPDSLCITAMCERANPFDAFLSPYVNWADLPSGAVVGTVSLRRQSQLLVVRPDLVIKPLRGNIQTRIQKMHNGEYDAILLAVAGLERMGLSHLIQSIFTADEILPACGQGALGIECRAEDKALRALLASLDDAATHLCVSTERAVNAALGGNCHTPLAVYCVPHEENGLYIRAKLADMKTGCMLAASIVGLAHESLQLAAQVVDQLRLQGAEDFLSC